MTKEGWLVKTNKLLAMRFFPDKFPEEDGTINMRVQYASCKPRFLHGITPYVVLHQSEKMSFRTAKQLWSSSLETDWEVSKFPLWTTC